MPIKQNKGGRKKLKKTLQPAEPVTIDKKAPIKKQKNRII